MTADGRDRRLRCGRGTHRLDGTSLIGVEFWEHAKGFPRVAVVYTDPYITILGI